MTSQSEKVYAMDFGKVYGLLVNKAVKKGRTREETDQVIRWLTGYDQAELEEMAEGHVTYGDFFRNAPKPNENRKLIKGVVCGVRGHVRCSRTGSFHIFVGWGICLCKLAVIESGIFSVSAHQFIVAAHLLDIAVFHIQKIVFSPYLCYHRLYSNCNVKGPGDEK